MCTTRLPLQTVTTHSLGWMKGGGTWQRQHVHDTAHVPPDPMVWREPHTPCSRLTAKRRELLHLTDLLYCDPARKGMRGSPGSP